MVENFTQDYEIGAYQKRMTEFTFGSSSCPLRSYFGT